MAQQRLLFVDAEHLFAYRWKSGELIAEGEFVADQAGLAAFSAYLERRRSSLFSLLADVSEEGFHSEGLPYVRGRDRVALIKRKLSQYYYGTPYSTAISQGREKTGRRDERFLFVALTRPQQFEPWLGALCSSESRLSGFYSIPLLASRLLELVEAAASNLLLISLTRGGLRQTFFERGMLRFSRLSPLVTNTAEEAAGAAAAESAKLYRYLAGQGLIAAGAVLPILVLAHPADLPRFAAQCLDTEELQFEMIDLLAKARQAGLKTLPTDSHSELLFLHLLTKVPPVEQLAALPERHYFQLWQLRLVIDSVAAIVILAFLLWSGKQWLEASQLEENTLRIQAQNIADRQRYDKFMATLPLVPVSTDNLRALIGRFEELERRSVSLAASYVRISDALRDAPRIELDSIEWQISASLDEGRQANVGNLWTAMPLAPGSLFVIADIHGFLPAAMAGDHRALRDAVNAFADRLRMGNATQVRVLSMPFDVDSDKTLTSDSPTKPGAVASRFSLQLLQKL
jgi:hypothetical protein